jgi:hypothetical protein
MKRSIDSISGGMSPRLEICESRPTQPASAEPPCVFSRLPSSLWREIMGPVVTDAQAIGPIRLVSRGWRQEMREWLTGPCTPLPPFDNTFADHFHRPHADLARLQSIIAVTGVLVLNEEMFDEPCSSYPQFRQIASSPDWNRLFSRGKISPEMIGDLLLVPNRPKEILLSVSHLADEAHLSQLLHLMKRAKWGLDAEIFTKHTNLEKEAVQQLADFVLHENWKGAFTFDIHCPALIKRLANDSALGNWTLKAKANAWGDAAHLAEYPPFELVFANNAGKEFIYQSNEEVDWDQVMALGMNISSFTAFNITPDQFHQLVKLLLMRPSSSLLEMDFTFISPLADVKENLETLLLHCTALTRLSLRDLAASGDENQARQLVAMIAKCTKLEICHFTDTDIFDGAQMFLLCDVLATLPRLRKVQVSLTDIPTLHDATQIIAACKNHPALHKLDFYVPNTPECLVFAEELAEQSEKEEISLKEAKVIDQINPSSAPIRICYRRVSPPAQ